VKYAKLLMFFKSDFLPTLVYEAWFIKHGLLDNLHWTEVADQSIYSREN